MHYESFLSPKLMYIMKVSYHHPFHIQWGTCQDLSLSPILVIYRTPGYTNMPKCIEVAMTLCRPKINAVNWYFWQFTVFLA